MVKRQPQIVSIGDRIQPGEFSLHSRFRRVINFTAGGSLVALVGEETGKGPVNLVVGELDSFRAETLRIEEDVITIDSVRFPFDRKKIFNSRLQAYATAAGRMSKNLMFLQKALADLSPPRSLAFLLDSGREKYFKSPFEREFVKRIRAGVGLILEGKHISDFFSGIARLKGLGFGLTPSGDDFIAGVLIALNLTGKVRGRDGRKLREKVLRIATGKNLLSNSFLSLAAGGFLSDRFNKLIFSLLFGGEREIRDTAGLVVSRGETSGSDTAVGFLMTLKKGEIPCS